MCVSLITEYFVRGKIVLIHPCVSTYYPYQYLQCQTSCAVLLTCKLKPKYNILSGVNYQQGTKKYLNIKTLLFYLMRAAFFG